MAQQLPGARWGVASYGLGREALATLGAKRLRVVRALGVASCGLGSLAPPHPTPFVGETLITLGT
jgi:hypothetical protein